jgi:hypothetical protein
MPEDILENLRFRVIRPDYKEVTLNWNETVEVIESGEWNSIQPIDHEFYPEGRNE